MRLALYLLATTAAVLAWTLSRRSPQHRIVAWCFTAYVVANAARGLLLAYVLPPPEGPPLEGTLLAALYADRAFYLVWRACLAAMAVSVLLKRRIWSVGVVYAASVVALALAYPVTRGEVLRKVYLAADLAALFVGIASLAVWVRRREPSDLTTRIVGVIFVSHLVAVIVGPYRFGLFGAEWVLQQAAYIVIWSIIILLQGNDLRTSSRSSG